MTRNVYIRSFVADGNFSADHLRLKGQGDDVWLLDGRGMMTERKTYHTHLAVAKEEKSVRVPKMFILLAF